MHYFENRPNHFRIVYAAVAALLLLISSVNLYRYATSPDDENVFRTSPSDIYITENIPGQLLELPADSTTYSRADSGIISGDLLLAINNEYFTVKENVDTLLAGIDTSATLEVVVFRPALAQELPFEVRRRDIADTSYRTIPSSVFVLEVLKGGASDRAGLKVGDIVYRINNQRFKDAREADQILRFAQVGKSIAYDVIRDDQIIVKQITLANIGIRLSVIMIALCGLLYMGTGIFLALRRPEFLAAQLLGWGLLSLGFFMSVIFQRPAVFTDVLDVLRDFFKLSAVFLSFPLMFHAGHYFPIERPTMVKKTWPRRGAYILAGVIILVIMLGQWRFFGIGLLVMTLYTVAVSLIYRKEYPMEYKKLNRIITRTGWVVAFLIIAGMAFILLVIKPDARSASWLVNGMISIPLALFPLAYLYTIGHYRLLNLDIRVRRNIQYNIVSSLWLIGLVAVSLLILFRLPSLELNLPNIQFQGTFLEVTDEPMAPGEQVVMEKMVLMLLTIGLIWLFWKIRRMGQGLLDRKYDRGEYDYRRAAGELAEVMAAQFTMNDLAEGMVQKLAGLMQVKQVGVLFFRGEANCCCSVAIGTDKTRWDEFSRAIDRRIINLIQQNRADYRFSADYLPDDIREQFELEGFRHIIAIRSKEKLVGVLLIGEKRSESPFHKDDLIFLSAVARQTSVAIENAFLYEELAEQQRLKHELDIARRIQIASLPQTHPRIPGLDISGISIPAQEVGGDYFDYLNGMPGEITIIVGDVSGKGTSAAFYMSKVQGIMRSLHDFGLSPRELFIRANQLLTNDLEKQSFITAVGASFKSGQRQLIYARAGHSPLFYYRASAGKVEMLIPRGMGMGLTKTAKFDQLLEEETLHYEPGDIFCFITDGITEAHSISGEEFGEEKLLHLLQECNGTSAKRIRDQIITAVNRFAENARQHDDLTVVVVKAV